MNTNEIEDVIENWDGWTDMMIMSLRDARRLGIIDDDTYDDIRHKLKHYMKYLYRQLRKRSEEKELNDFVKGKTKKLSKNDKVRQQQIKFNKGEF